MPGPMKKLASTPTKLKFAKLTLAKIGDAHGGDDTADGAIYSNRCSVLAPVCPTKTQRAECVA